MHASRWSHPLFTFVLIFQIIASFVLPAGVQAGAAPTRAFEAVQHASALSQPLPVMAKLPAVGTDSQSPGSPEQTTLDVKIISTPWAILDHNSPGSPDTPHVLVIEASVTNKGAQPANNLVVSLDYNASPWVLLPGEDATRTILAPLAPGATYYAYWFASYSSVIGAGFAYSVTASAGNAAPVTTSTNFYGNPEPGKTVQTRSAISTGNSGITKVSSSVTVGVAFTVSITYTLGTNPLNIILSPVGNLDFNAGSNRLLSASVKFFNNAGTFSQTVADQLYFPTIDSRAEKARVSFVFIPLIASNTRICTYAAVGYASSEKYDQFYCSLTKNTSIPINGSLSFVLSKKADKLIAQQGEIINYTIHYTNTGTAPLSYVWIWDDLNPSQASANLTSVTPAYDPTKTTDSHIVWYIGNIPEVGVPGYRGVLSFNAVVGRTSDIVDLTPLQNTASLGINPGELPATPAETSSVTTTIQAPTVSIQKSDGLTTAEPGSKLTYSIQITNTGSIPASTVVITDVLPSGVTLDGIPLPLPTSQDSQTLVWNNLGPLVPAGIINISIPVVVKMKTENGTDLTTPAMVDYSNSVGHEFLKKIATDHTIVTGPVLTINNSDAPDPVLTGKLIHYTLAYANTGPASATNVVITDTVPLNTTYDACSGCSQAGGVVTWNIGTVAAGGSGTVTFTARVDDLLPNGTLIHNNHYGIISDQTNYLAGADITTVVNRDADIFVGTTFIDTDGDGVIDVGEGTLSGITVTMPQAVTPVVNTVDGAYNFRVEVSGAGVISAADVPDYFRTTPGAVNVQSTFGITQTVNFGYAPIASGFGVLFGIVYEDKNHDGLVDLGENGIPGVQVASSQATPSTVTTDAFGRYSLHFNSAGDATITETKPFGYVSTTLTQVQRTIAIGSDNASPLDFGNFLGIKITGQVFNDLNVNGAKDAGETGLADAGVTVGSTTITTDGTGSYIIFTPVTGSPILITESNPAGFVSTNALPGAGMIKVDEDSSRIVAPASGTTYSGADFGDAQSSSVVTIQGSVWDDNGAGGGILANGIHDGTEPGLAGAVISLSTGLSQTIGPDGLFALLAPVNQVVRITEQNPAGYASTNAVPGGSAIKVDNDTLEVSALPIGGSSTDNLFGDVQTASVAVISGTVFDDQNENGVLNPGEPGKPGVSITLEINGIPFPIVQSTGSNGSYQFAVSPGADVRITSAGPGGGFHPTTPESLVLRLVSAGNYPGVNFGYSDDSDNAVIFGLVFDDRNSNGLADFGELGLPGAQVWLDESTSVTTGSGLNAGVFSFVFPAVFMSTFTRLREVNPTGYRSTTPDVLNIALTPAVYSYYVTFGDTISSNVASLYGVVFDDLNQNGVFDPTEPSMAGVAISLTVGGPSGVVVVSSAGYGIFSYSFDINAEGYHTVSEQDPAKPGYHSTTPDSVNVLVEVGHSYVINFGDTQGGYAIFGTVFDDISGDGVQDSSELGLAGVTVSLSSGDTTTTRVGGGYTFGVPTPGAEPYSVQVVESDPAEYHSTTPNTVIVSLSTEVHSYAVNFGDSKSQSISSIFGTVFNDLNANGQFDLEPGLPGITVTISGATSLDAVTNAWGQYTFVVEATGDYTLTETDPLGWVSTGAFPGGLGVVKVDNNTLQATVSSLGLGMDNNRFGDALETQVVTISGVVWDDNGAGGGTRGDGARNGTEPGLAGATVSLSSGMSLVTVSNGAFTLYAPPVPSITVNETNPTGYISSGSVAGNNASRVNNDSLVINGLAGGGVSSGNLFGDVAKNSVAVISGVVYNDVNGNGVKDTGDAGLPGVKITIDGVVNVFTNASGQYSYLAPDAGVHQIVETDPSLYFSTTPNEVHVKVVLGNNYQVNFGDASTNSGFATIFGTVYDDDNSNSVFDNGEAGIPGVTITLDVGRTAVTDANGNFTFDTSVAGDHTVTETDPFSYVSTTPNIELVNVSMGHGYSVLFGDRLRFTCSNDLFEDDDSFAYASPIDSGVLNKQAHNFCDDGEDWISFTATFRGIYTIQTSATGARADTYLTLYNQDGTTVLMANDDIAGTTDYSSQITWEALADGVYFVKISNQSSQMIHYSTDYEVWVEFNENPIKLFYLPLIMNISNAGAGSQVTQKEVQAAVEQPAAPPKGIESATSIISLKNVPLPGVYDSQHTLAPLGVIDHLCKDAFEVDDTREQARPIVAGVPQIHSFDSNPALFAADKDLVWFEAQAGDIITFTTVLTNTQVGLELFDQEGFALGKSGINSLIWTADSFGKYYLSATPLTTNFGCADVSGYQLLMEVVSLKRLYLPFIIR